MSTKELVSGYEIIARQIQGFMWNGRPFKSEKKDCTKEELEQLLESIRSECWSNYDSASHELGWRD
jgi:hypothetical protein